MSKKRPENCITVEQAKELEKTWCDTRTLEIDKCLGFEDSREFEWSVEELMEYLKYVKRKSKKQGILNPGVRVYLGAYPKEKCKMNRGYATAFFAPTGNLVGSRGKGYAAGLNNYKIRPYNHGSAGDPPHKY